MRLIAHNAQNNADPYHYLDRSLEYASAYGDQAIVELLLERGASPYSGFLGAIQYRQYNILQYLVSQGTTSNFRLALEMGDLEALRILCESTNEWNRALDYAVELLQEDRNQEAQESHVRHTEHNLHMIVYLLDNGASRDQAFISAAWHGSTELLKAMGEDLEVVFRAGRTAALIGLRLGPRMWLRWGQMSYWALCDGF